MDQDFTKNVEWPKAFGNRICILNLKKSHQSRTERRSAIKSMRQSDHFESVEWDRAISANTGLNSASTSSDINDVSFSTLDLIMSPQGEGFF